MIVQKLNKRGNINLKNFCEFFESRVLKTVGDVTATNDIIIPIRMEFVINPNSLYIL